MPFALTTEMLLSSPAAFALTTLTPLQRAICRVKDGCPLGELGGHPEVVHAFGGASAIRELERMGRAFIRPAEFVLIAGIRTFKSLFAAAAALELSQNVDCSALSAGDIVRIPIFSLKLSIKAVLNHLVSNMRGRPALEGLILGDPTPISVALCHPTGRKILVEQVAMGTAGVSMVSDYHAGDIGDEVPRMVGEADGAKNFDEMRRASSGRRLPGAQAIWIGSPHAPFGPAYKLVTEFHGRPSPDRVVVRGSGPALNPFWWTPERCSDMQRRDPQGYQTDVRGEFADPETNLLSSLELSAVTRATPLELPPQTGHAYSAAMDPATRGNAWTLVVLTKTREGLPAVVLARQWVGSKAAPLSPDKVLGEIASILAPYRTRHVATDQYSTDAIKDIARRHELYLYERAWAVESRYEKYDKLRVAIADGRIELSPEPMLRSDLLSIRRRVTQAAVTIELPVTSDGRHCDYAPALAMAFDEFLAAPEAEKPTTAAAAKEAVEQAAERSFLRRAERSEASRLAAQFGLSFGEEMEDP